MKDAVHLKFFHRCLFRYDSEIVEIEALIKVLLHCNRMLLIELPFFFCGTEKYFHVSRKAEIMGQTPLVISCKS